MVKIKFAAFTMAALAMAGVTALAQQKATQAGIAGALPDGKIAVLNTSAFPGQIGELKQKYDQVDNQFKPRYDKLKTLDEQLKALENDIRTKSSVLPADKLQEMQNNYEDMKKRGSRDLEDLRTEYDKAIDTATRPVRDKLYQFLQNYAAQRGIVLIINLAGAAQTGSLAYWSPGADVTEDFIKEYNKANPVAGAPATQPQPGPVKPASNKP